MPAAAKALKSQRSSKATPFSCTSRILRKSDITSTIRDELPCNKDESTSCGRRLSREVHFLIPSIAKSIFPNFVEYDKHDLACTTSLALRDDCNSCSVFSFRAALILYSLLFTINKGRFLCKHSTAPKTS